MSTKKSTANGNGRQRRVVSKETALSLFESALSYMLEADWSIEFVVERQENGTPVTRIAIVGIEFVVDENGVGGFQLPMPQPPPPVAITATTTNAEMNA